MVLHTHHNFTPFIKGQKVWLKARNLKCSIANLNFVPKQEGLFIITKVLSLITYQLCLSKAWKIQNTFYAFLLSPYYKNSVYRLNFPQSSDLIEDEEEYGIEKILH